MSNKGVTILKYDTVMCVQQIKSVHNLNNSDSLYFVKLTKENTQGMVLQMVKQNGLQKLHVKFQCQSTLIQHI